MNLLVDTSVWSLALRRDVPDPSPKVALLATALRVGGTVFTTGLILQELLQGFHGARAGKMILQQFTSLPFIVPDCDDHVAAAALRNSCRRRGIQVGTIDALLAQLCIRHRLSMLTTDTDFELVAKHTELSLA